MQQIEIELDDEELGVDELSESEMKEPFDPSKIKILPAQDTLVNLINRMKHSEIDMNTDFQRHAELWDNQKMSRFIESILIRFPLPAFFFDATNDEKWLIVDGLQRLSTINKFVIEKKFKLKGLEYLHSLNGKTYDEIGRIYQRRIDECPITYSKILPGTPEEVKYSIFKRINTGGLSLNSQEIRNALAKPREKELLKKLSVDANFINMMGDFSRRMLDHELVLRFLAFYMARGTEIKVRKNVVEFLDTAMTELKSKNDLELSLLAVAFKRSMQRAYSLFGESAFEKRDDADFNQRRKRKNAALFEVWSVRLAELPEIDFKKIENNKAYLIQRHAEAMRPNNPYYISISIATQNIEHVKSRYSTVDGIIRDALAK